MYSMIFECLGIYQDVIQGHYNKVVQVIGKHVVHQVHKRRWGIRHSKWNQQKLVQTPTSFERCFGYVFFPQRYLPIS